MWSGCPVFPFGKVGENLLEEYAVNPVEISVTDILSKLAPEGTTTESEVVVADVGVAIVDPKNTTLFAGVLLKFVPVIVTVEPTSPNNGLKDVIVGCCPTA
jgi:hypothetical protein